MPPGVLQKGPICKRSCKLLATPNIPAAISLACATHCRTVSVTAWIRCGPLHFTLTPAPPSAALTLFAALLLAALCALALALDSSSSAATPQEKLEATQSKLDQVHANQSALAETIAEQNAAIDSMIGEVSALRQKQAAVEAELAEKEDELEAGHRRARKGTRPPGRSPRPAEPGPRGAARTAGLDLRGGLAGRPQRRSSNPKNWSKHGGPDRIPEPDPELRQLRRRPGQDAPQRSRRRGRQADLRRGRRSKAARDSIAATEQEVAAAKEAAEARFAELQAAQAEPPGDDGIARVTRNRR